MDFCHFPLLTAYCECKCHRNPSTKISPFGLVPCVQLAVCCFVQSTLGNVIIPNQVSRLMEARLRYALMRWQLAFLCHRPKLFMSDNNAFQQKTVVLRNAAFNFYSISVVRSYHGSHQYLVSTRRAELEERSIGDPPSSSFLPGHIVIREGWKEKRNTFWPQCHCPLHTPLLLGFSSFPDDLPSTTRSETSKSPAALSSLFPFFTFFIFGFCRWRSPLRWDSRDVVVQRALRSARRYGRREPLHCARLLGTRLSGTGKMRRREQRRGGGPYGWLESALSYPGKPSRSLFGGPTAYKVCLLRRRKKTVKHTRSSKSQSHWSRRRPIEPIGTTLDLPAPTCMGHTGLLALPSTNDC